MAVAEHTYSYLAPSGVAIETAGLSFRPRVLDGELDRQQARHPLCHSMRDATAGIGSQRAT
jgi:hypothetical protein